MKFPLFLLFHALLASAYAEYRTFTDTQDRTLEAELIKANTTHAWLRLRGGRVVPVNRETLSEADQTFITTWIADKVPDLEVTPDFDRGLSKDRGKGSSSTRQTFGMRVEIKNFSPKKELEDSEVVYYLIGRSVFDNDQYKVLSRQVFDISIKPGDTKKAIFKDIENHFQEVERSNNGKEKGRGHRGLGYVLQIQRKRDMRLIYLGSSTSLLDDAKEAIISLEEGDETDETFMTKDEEAKMVEKSEPGKPEVITIK